jgi:hypothetical protein
MKKLLYTIFLATFFTAAITSPSSAWFTQPNSSDTENGNGNGNDDGSTLAVGGNSGGSGTEENDSGSSSASNTGTTTTPAGLSYTVQEANEAAQETNNSFSLSFK